jgi:hypothetical protein
VLIRWIVLTLFYALLRKNLQDDAFGGVQVLFIGDLFQLPPVVKDDEWAVLERLLRYTFLF